MGISISEDVDFDEISMSMTREKMLSAFIGGRKALLECREAYAYANEAVPELNPVLNWDIKLVGFLIIGALPDVLRAAFLAEYQPALILLKPRIKLARLEDWERFIESLSTLGGRRRTGCGLS